MSAEWEFCGNAANVQKDDIRQRQAKRLLNAMNHLGRDQTQFKRDKRGGKVSETSAGYQILNLGIREPTRNFKPGGGGGGSNAFPFRD